MSYFPAKGIPTGALKNLYGPPYHNGIISDCITKCKKDSNCGGTFWNALGSFHKHGMKASANCWDIPKKAVSDKYYLVYPNDPSKNISYYSYINMNYLNNNTDDYNVWYNSLDNYDAYVGHTLDGDIKSVTHGVFAPDCATMCNDDADCFGFKSKFTHNSQLSLYEPICEMFNSSESNVPLIEADSHHTTTYFKNPNIPRSPSDIIMSKFAVAPNSKCGLASDGKVDDLSFSCYYNHAPNKPTDPILSYMFPGDVFSMSTSNKSAYKKTNSQTAAANANKTYHYSG